MAPPKALQKVHLPLPSSNALEPGRASRRPRVRRAAETALPRTQAWGRKLVVTDLLSGLDARAATAYN